MAKKGVKSVAIAGSADKRSITGTFVITLNGDFLPLQLIYGGKTKRGLPGKDLISEIQTKMLKASQVAGFLNQLYLKEKWMKLSSLLYVDTN